MTKNSLLQWSLSREIWQKSWMQWLVVWKMGSKNAEKWKNLAKNNTLGHHRSYGYLKKVIQTDTRKSLKKFKPWAHLLYNLIVSNASFQTYTRRLTIVRLIASTTSHQDFAASRSTSRSLNRRGAREGARPKSNSRASKTSLEGAISYGQERKSSRFLSALVWQKLKSTSGGGTRPENGWKSSKVQTALSYRSHANRTEIRQICLLKHLVGLSPLMSKRMKKKSLNMTKKFRKFLVKSINMRTNRTQQPKNLTHRQKIRHATYT